MKSKRKKHSAAFKAKVAIEALQERETLSEIARKYDLHPNLISKWKSEFLERAPELFQKKFEEKHSEIDVEKFYTKIGKLEMERDYLKKNLKKLGL